MSNPTTPFSWQMPTATDLVTDLPADFEVFGQAVATSMADLLGGTSGQVLAKNSNTDMDFVWVTSDDANAIQNTIVDAKGDLIAASAADTPARLAVGNNGETLVADSSTSTGLRYTAGTVQANPVLNSAAQIWQRGTSMTGSTTAFCADRWQAYRNTTGSTFSRQVTGDTTNLPNIQYAIRAQRDSGNTATNDLNITQNMETANSIPFAGKTVTISFYARRGANFSQASNQIFTQVFTGTGTDQNLYVGYTGVTTAANFQSTLTTTWQRFSSTFSFAATATEISMVFGYGPVGTAGANDYFELTGVQLDIGSVALPFRTYAGTIQGELAACQRYFVNAQTDARFPSPNASGSWVSSIFLPVTMRTTPTVAFNGAATSANIASATLAALSYNNFIRNNLVTTSGSNTDSYYVRDITASAEL